jgi:hypothetical protein
MYIWPRITKRTRGLQEWVQIPLDATRLTGHLAQGLVEVADKLSLRGVVSVVGGLDAHVMPKGFDRVELRAVLGQRAEVKAMTIGAQPLPHLRCPMVGGVVVDQEHFPPAVAVRQAVQKGGVASTFKDVAMPVVELGTIQIDRSKDLLGVPLPRRRNQRLVSASRPRLVQARILTETGLIRKQQSGVAIGGFFLAGDTYSAANGPVRADRP